MKSNFATSTKVQRAKSITRSDLILEIRTGAPLLWNLVSGLRHARSLIVYPGNADILEQFNISHGAVRQTRRPPSFSFSQYSFPSTSRISISDLRSGTPASFPSPLSSECLRELRSSFPLSIRCARKFMSAPVYCTRYSAFLPLLKGTPSPRESRTRVSIEKIIARRELRHFTIAES